MQDLWEGKSMGLPSTKQSSGLFSVRAAKGANPATPAKKNFKGFCPLEVFYF